MSAGWSLRLADDDCEWDTEPIAALTPGDAFAAQKLIGVTHVSDFWVDENGNYFHWLTDEYKAALAHGFEGVDE